MTSAIKAIPDGFHTVTAYMTVKGAADAIDFYKKAFGAVELVRLPMPGDQKLLMHAAIRIGDSVVMMADEFPGCAGSAGPATLGGTCVTLHLYVPDVDKSMAQAEKAGCKVTMPQMDMFWGDRFGQVVDPFGHRWSIATHTRDLTPEQILEGAAEAFKQMPASSAAQ